MIVDCHNHIGYRKGAYFSAEQCIQWMEESGVDRAVVFAQCEAIDNDYVAESAARYPQSLIGFAQLNPWDYSAVEDLSRYCAQLGLRGLKLNPTRHGYALDRHQILDPLFEVSEALGIVIISHGKDDLFTMPGKFEAMARAFPKVPLIMAHMGLDRAFNAALRAARRHKNLYLDTAGVHPKAISSAIEEVGPEKILMGTDAPWGRFSLSLQAVDAATDDLSIRNLIKGGNLARLLDLN